MYILLYTLPGADNKIHTVGAASISTLRKWQKRNLDSKHYAWRIFDCSDRTWIGSGGIDPWKHIRHEPVSVDMIAYKEKA